MGSAAIRNEYSTLPVSKWDARIRNNKRKRNAEIRKHILLLIFAVVFIFVAILGINRMISEAGKAEEEALSFKYYKSWLNSKRIYRYAYIFLCLIFVGKLI